LLDSLLQEIKKVEHIKKPTLNLVLDCKF